MFRGNLIGEYAFLLMFCMEIAISILNSENWSLAKLAHLQITERSIDSQCKAGSGWI